MLAIDANILIRAVLGRRARTILETYAEVVQFLVADVVVEEARSHLPGILTKRGLDPQPALTVLDRLLDKLKVVEADVYGNSEKDAKQRLANRDLNDWPIVAVALTFGCPYGQKTPISLGPESRPGPATASKYSCAPAPVAKAQQLWINR